MNIRVTKVTRFCFAMSISYFNIIFVDSFTDFQISKNLKKYIFEYHKKFGIDFCFYLVYNIYRKRG